MAAEPQNVSVSEDLNLVPVIETFHNCVNCATIEQQLHLANLELKSAKTIISLLQDDLKSIERELTSTHQTTPSTSVLTSDLTLNEQYKVKWSTIIPSANKVTKSFDSCSKKVNTKQQFISPNLYAPLSTLEDDQSEPNCTSDPHRSAYLPKRTSSHLKPGKKIPTIINGRTYQFGNNSKPKGSTNNFCSYKSVCDRKNTNDSSIHSVVSPSDSVKDHLTTNHSYDHSIKHKIVLIGDSHLRGYADSLKHQLNSKCDIYSVVKPGSGTSELKETATEVIRHLSQEDCLLVCSGANDYEINGFSSTFQNLKTFMTLKNNTNIILMNIPFRYDLPNFAAVNVTINSLNKKLEKLAKAYTYTSFIDTNNDRSMFTKHGLHFNKLGKRSIIQKLAGLLTSTFDRKSPQPIFLGWNETHDDNTLDEDIDQNSNNNVTTGELEQDKTGNRYPTRSKKVPITRTNDFSWIV